MLLAPMLQRLAAARDLQEVLQTALADIVALHGAERGNIQLFNSAGQLLIVRQLGLSREFLQVFSRVELADGSICGRAAALQDTVFVPDVEQDEAFRPFLPVARAAPFRSVLSCPLMSSAAGCIGMASVHFAHPFTPSRLELDSLQSYCRRLADRLVERHEPVELHRQAEALASEILAAAQ